MEPYFFMFFIHQILCFLQKYKINIPIPRNYISPCTITFNTPSLYTGLRSGDMKEKKVPDQNADFDPFTNILRPFSGAGTYL